MKRRWRAAKRMRVVKAVWQQASKVKRWVDNSLSAPLMLCYFLLLLLNTLLRDTKDTLLVTSTAGVEAIPILKSWAVIPGSFLYFLTYYKLSSMMTPRQVFIFILFMFTSFYFFFATVLYPRQYALQARGFTEMEVLESPGNTHPFRHLIENWPLGIFYVVSELWASAVCQLLFWQVANAVVSMEEAKSIYPLVGASGNLGMVVAGRMLRDFANQRDFVAANAYLRVKDIANGNSLRGTGISGERHLLSSTTGLLEPGSTGDASFMGKDIQVKQMEGSYTNSLGYSIFSDWMLPFFGSSSLKPSDQAWQGTLIGISIMLAVSSVAIVWLYDIVHERAAIKAEAAAALSNGWMVNENGSSSSSSGGGGGHHNGINGHSPLAEQHLGPNGSGLGQQNVKRRTGSANNSEAQHRMQNMTSPHGKELETFTRNSAGFDVLDGKMEIGPGEGEKTEDTNVINVNRKYSDGASLKKTKKKVKVSLWEGLQTLSKSTPLRCAAILVISYGVSISLVEVSWKGQVKLALSGNDYSRFMGMFWTITGLVSMSFMFLGKLVLQRVGYTAAVLVTPISMAVAGSLFFMVSVFEDLGSSGSDSRSAWAAYFGGAAVLFAKSAKYAFFDATKEIIFIPLDEDSKSLGKAAIDVVAYRLSKSGGSVLLQMVIVVCGSLSTTLGILPIAVVFVLVVLSWIHAALQVSQFISSTDGSSGAASNSPSGQRSSASGEHIV